MIVRLGSSIRWPTIAQPRIWPSAVVALVLVWMTIVGVRAALLVWEALGDLLANPSLSRYATPAVIAAMGLCYVSPLVLALAVRWWRPAATLPTIVALTGIIVLAAAAATGSLLALAVALALVALAFLLGDALLSRLPSAPTTIVLLPVSVALGLGVLGLYLFVLAALSRLSGSTILVSTAGLVLLLLVVDRVRLARRLQQASLLRLPIPSRFETTVIGLTIGLLTYALLAAFVPETTSDAIRQHMPFVREIWQTGSVARFAYLDVSQALYPMQAHLLYATAFGFGGMIAAKLVHAFVALMTIAAVASLGWLICGRLAAVLGATLFATIPLVLWLLGHALPDQFAAFFSVTSLCCAVVWQRNGSLPWLVASGALAGFGFASKLNAGLLIIVLALGLFIIGRQPWQWHERVLAVAAFGAGCLVIVPWLVRAYLFRETARGLQVVTERLGPTPAVSSAADVAVGAGANGSVFDVMQFLVHGPWLWPFHAGPSNWQIVQHGELGIALLLLLPLTFLALRTRPTVLVAFVAVVFFVGWWLTIQNPRHLLPAIALASALVGIAVANVLVEHVPRPGTVIPLAAQTGVIAALVAAPIFFFPNTTTQLPLRFIAGRESAADYVERVIPAATILETATTLLPADTLVGYIGLWEGAQLYTEARLIPLGTYWPVGNRLDTQLAAEPELILASLENLGLEHVIWDRDATRIEDWRSTLLSTAFLSGHTRILAADRSVYLLEVLPDSGAGWGAQRLTNLLGDPDLENVKRGSASWQATGTIKAQKGLVAIRGEGTIRQDVPVSGGKPYLLVATARCESDDAHAGLGLSWLDERGAELGAISEAVIPGSSWSEQIVWHRAPRQAASVAVQLTGRRCEFDKAALYLMS